MKHGSRILKGQIAVVAVIHLLAVVSLFFVTPTAIIALLVAHLLTGGFGISIGFHRFLAHRSFETSPLTGGFLALMGTLAFQRGPISWVAFHRAHHQRENRTGDPHASIKGFWWSHMLWIFKVGPNGFHFRKMRRSLKDISNNRFLKFLERNHNLINILSWALLWAFFGISVALVAGPLRIVIVWHSTWAINSICHHRGIQGASSLNKNWLAWLTYGEGFHKNHHQKQNSPRFSVHRNEIDFGYGIIKLMNLLHIVSIKPEMKTNQTKFRDSIYG